MVTKTRGGDMSPQKLTFNEKLVGKGHSTDALLKKLKALHIQLAELDQELVDVNSLGAARKELVHTSILLHKDRGVKAYAACCLADILRLYAPDAPYTQSELRDIFQFFFRQLTNGLKSTDESYYNEYFHLLESLSTVKSVVLVCDLQNADELMVDIFRDFFGLVRRDLAKKIEMFMADILVALIDECQSLPSDVLETIMAQFMDNNARMEQPAYRLAVQVCNATSDKLQRHVCQYFTDIIVAHSRDEEFDEIRTAHDLVKRLNRSCPSLLHSVVPQLEEELRVQNVQLRLIAAQVLGEMFSDKGGADLVKKYPTTWNMWLLRKNDKSAAVRLKFVESTKGCLINLPDHREIIEEALCSKVLDPDEKVRAAACKVYSQLDYETALHHVSETQLRTVAGRGVDKKQLVRIEALNSVGKLYSLAYPEIENNEQAAIRQFSWIPNEVLNMMGANVEVRAVAEQVIAEYILPLPSSSSTGSSSKGGDIDESAWTDRLVNTMKLLDEKAIKALLSLTGLKANRPTIYDHYVSACMKNNGGVIDEHDETITQRLSAVVQHVAAQFPDAHKFTEDLHAFAKLNERRLYKLLTTCMDPQTDLRSLVKATHEFLKRVEQSSPSITSTMSTLLRRSSLRILNQSSIPTLVKRIQKVGGNSTGQTSLSANNAQILLSFTSKHCPALYKPHVGELTKAIADEKNSRLVEVCLQALSSVVKWDDKLASSDKRTNERIMRYVLESRPRHAKFAARLLAYAKNRDEACAQVIESISAGLSEADPELLVAHITVLAQFAKLAPDAFENKSDVIMAFLLKHVLMVPSPLDPEGMEVDEEWVEDDAVAPALSAKIQTLKVCRNRCLAHASKDTALDISTPALKMFTTLLDYGGSFSAEAVDDPKVKSRLRLQAAISLLHLSTVEAYANAISQKFVTLAITIQDTCYHVRMIFLMKLVSLLTPRKLPPRFNVIPFLTVHDPEADVRSTAAAYISFASRNMSSTIKVEHFEMIFIRLLHFLAHHPDFSASHQDLPDIAKYVEFYLDHIASPETVSLLYHLAMKAKTVRDADPHIESENLYIMSELAQEFIKFRCQLHSWNLQGYPGKVKLPSDILRALPNPETANKILKTTYLPEETITWLADRSKTKAVSQPKEKRERKSVTKRKAARRSNEHAKRRQRTKKWHSDDSDVKGPSDSQSSEIEMAPETEAQASSSDEAAEGEERLGRGARTLAKARIRKQARKTTKNKTEPVA